MAASRITPEAFDALYPVGTKVLFRPWAGASPIATETRSTARVTGCGHVVVLLAGRAGAVSYYALEFPISETTT